MENKLTGRICGLADTYQVPPEQIAAILQVCVHKTIAAMTEEGVSGDAGDPQAAR